MTTNDRVLLIRGEQKSPSSHPNEEDRRRRKKIPATSKIRGVLFVAFLIVLSRQLWAAIHYQFASTDFDLAWDAVRHTPASTSFEAANSTQVFSDYTVGNATQLESRSNVLLRRGEIKRPHDKESFNNQEIETDDPGFTDRLQIKLSSVNQPDTHRNVPSPYQNRSGHDDGARMSTLIKSITNAKQEQAVLFDGGVVTNNSLSLSSSGGNKTMIDNYRFDKALERTTRILYQEGDLSERDYWLGQPAPRVFIYDTLPEEWSSVSNVSACVDQTFGITRLDHSVGTRTTVSSDWKNCQWLPGVCTDIHPGQTEKRQGFLSYRYNYNSDVAYLKRFYDYPYRTDNPDQADLFLVPYPHKSHCVCHKDFSSFSARCDLTPVQIQDNVLNRLSYYRRNDNEAGSLARNDTRTARHVFLFGADWTHQHSAMTKAVTNSNSMTLSLGPSPSIGQHWTVPYVSTGPDLQPKVVLMDRPEEFWTTRERPYMVGAAFGMGKRLKERHDFVQHWKEYLGGTHMGGKKHLIVGMTSTRVIKKRLGDDIMEIYRNSTFCLIVSTVAQLE
jgi:hypothetical protein